MERDARLLAVAAAMFEARGFDATTMDSVAEAAGVGKPTIYARYRDKAELFKAIYRARVAAVLTPLAVEVQAVIEMQLTPERGEATLGGDIETVLNQIGLTLLPRVLSSQSIGINRVILAEAVRFPELALLIQQEGWQATVLILAGLLRAFVLNGQIVVEDAEEAADLFLSLLLGRLQRSAMLGLLEIDDAGIRRRVRMAVGIFMRGVSP